MFGRISILDLVSQFLANLFYLLISKQVAGVDTIEHCLFLFNPPWWYRFPGWPSRLRLHSWRLQRIWSFYPSDAVLVEPLLYARYCSSLPLHHTGQAGSEFLLAAVGELELVLLSIVGDWRNAFYLVRHVNVQSVYIKVYHLFGELAEPAYTPALLRPAGAVVAHHRTDVAKLIHTLEGRKLVLVAFALYFQTIGLSLFV